MTRRGPEGERTPGWPSKPVFLSGCYRPRSPLARSSLWPETHRPAGGAAPVHAREMQTERAPQWPGALLWGHPCDNRTVLGSLTSDGKLRAEGPSAHRRPGRRSRNRAQSPGSVCACTLLGTGRPQRDPE